MTATSTTQSLTHDSAVVDRRTSALVGFVSYVVGAAFTVPNAHKASEVAVVLVAAAIVALGVYGWLVPRGTATGTPGTALGLSVVAALLLLPAFWSMLPLLLGVAGVMIGRACTGFASKRSYAAVGLGAIAVAGYLYLYVVLGLIMGDL
jgi:hypothetical protein